MEEGVGRGEAEVLVMQRCSISCATNDQHMQEDLYSSYAADLTAMSEAVDFSLLGALQGHSGESRLRRLGERLWELSEGGRISLRCGCNATVGP